MAAILLPCGKPVQSPVQCRPEALDGWVVDPCGSSTSVPIWVGGQSRASFDRAVRFGNGWMPFALPMEQIADWIRSADLPSDFEVVFGPMPPLDPMGDPNGVERVIEEHERAGATGLAMRFEHRSLTHYFEQLEADRITRYHVGRLRHLGYDVALTATPPTRPPTQAFS